ncbi:AI-2E family transporter [Tepidiforma bonchosmolovskayae]|jgi:predicted PurR-regulated permease PerM|uniref:AI-2E family transporter n=1 Tax=Tepidiforma bonchosmolovskayae TaxID=2601677 RepID=A0ABX6BZ33_9CHLR|nr:AI-2E family transporter [Tepidiforma bonchosmolovskayae]QFG02251.1 AI-2E family transporter [Tepidiforma bonchosmolovskayae]
MIRLELSFRGILAIALVLVGLWFLIQLWPLLLILTTSFIFMAALLPYVEWMVRRGINRVAAVVIILVIILAVLGSMIAIVAPAVVDEFRDLRANLPDYARDVETFASDLGFNTERWDLPERAAEIDWNRIISGSQVVDYGQRVLVGILTGLTVAVITAYLLVETHRLRAFLFRFIPPEREADAQHFLRALERVVGGYVRGQLITSLIIGVYTTVVMLLVGVPNAIAFGVLAAFADIIPLVGGIIAVVPASIAAFQESPTQALIVLVALLVYQQFEDRLLVPRVYGQTLNLPALVVLLAVLAGAELMGVVGVLLALPAAAAGRVVLDYYLDRHASGRLAADESVEVLAPDEPPATP